MGDSALNGEQVQAGGAAYVLLGQHDRGLYEYHVYCTLGAGDILEFVTPDDEVVAQWPDADRPADAGLVSRGDRFFHARGDLKVRTVFRPPQD